MGNFDEYQKLLRYKYGSHAFMILISLQFINFGLGLFTDFQWGETREAEYILLIFIPILYSLIMYIYHGAYFLKNQNGKLYSILFFIIGILLISQGFSPYADIVSDGLVTLNAIGPVSGLIWISISLSYVVRNLVEKRKEADEED